MPKVLDLFPVLINTDVLGDCRTIAVFNLTDRELLAVKSFGLSKLWLEPNEDIDN